MAATFYNTADTAAKLDTTPRTLRKFLRSPEGMDAKVGKGARWSIAAKDVRSLQSRFNKWEAAQAADRAARAAAKLEAAEAAPEDDDTPSDAELMAIDDEVDEG